MRVLVTGGAGYIGSAVVERLLADGDDVVVVDDLSSGHRDAIADGASLVVADAGDRASMASVCLEFRVDGVIHMAARSIVSASMIDPAGYYEANVASTLRLLEGMLGAGVRRFVFSSTAAVYGNSATVPIREYDVLEPTSPYGASKLAIERALPWYEQAYGLSSVALRYFNAAGATAASAERHHPETHLIPRVLDAAEIGADVHVFGEDHQTSDGTCERDYVHVADLADAHARALRYLAGGNQGGAFNLGCGRGRSVRQVIEAARKVTGRQVGTIAAPRRAGDPAVLVANFDKARAQLGWTPTRSSLDEIIRDAWSRRAGQGGAR